MKSRLMKSIVSIVALSLCASYALADGQIRGRLGVKLVIGKGCEVSGTGVVGRLLGSFGTLDFGEHSSLANQIDAESNVSGGGNLRLKCTNGTSYTVSLDNGMNATGTQRRMSSGGLIGTEYVSYDLYKDSSRTTKWDSTSALSGSGDGNAADLIAYGRVTEQTTPSSGTYTDTVTMTVAW